MEKIFPRWIKLPSWILVSLFSFQLEKGMDEFAADKKNNFSKPPQARTGSVG
jgi:hypothetical protein